MCERFYINNNYNSDNNNNKNGKNSNNKDNNNKLDWVFDYFKMVIGNGAIVTFELKLNNKIG